MVGHDWWTHLHLYLQPKYWQRRLDKAIVKYILPETLLRLMQGSFGQEAWQR